MTPAVTSTATLAKNLTAEVEEAASFDQLTARERQVALALANGLKNAEIADTLDISVKTIDTHRGHILQKLKLRHNVDICRLAIRLGLVTP